MIVLGTALQFRCHGPYTNEVSACWYPCPIRWEMASWIPNPSFLFLASAKLLAISWGRHQMMWHVHFTSAGGLQKSSADVLELFRCPMQSATLILIIFNWKFIWVQASHCGMPSLCLRVLVVVTAHQVLHLRHPIDTATSFLFVGPLLAFISRRIHPLGTQNLLEYLHGYPYLIK